MTGLLGQEGVQGMHWASWEGQVCPPDWKYTDVLADYTGQGRDASAGDLRCSFLWVKGDQSDKRKRHCQWSWRRLRVETVTVCFFLFPNRLCPRFSFGGARVLRWRVRTGNHRPSPFPRLLSQWKLWWTQDHVNRSEPQPSLLRRTLQRPRNGGRGSSATRSSPVSEGWWQGPRTAGCRDQIWSLGKISPRSTENQPFSP